MTIGADEVKIGWVDLGEEGLCASAVDPSVPESLGQISIISERGTYLTTCYSYGNGKTSSYSCDNNTPIVKVKRTAELELMALSGIN